MKPLSDVSLANVFSHMVSYLFILMMVSLAMHQLFILMQSHLFVLSCISLAVEDVLAKILLCRISEIFLPMFSSRTFMVLHIMFKSFIHFEFILVYGVSWWSGFIFFACMISDLPAPLVEEAIFTPFYASIPLVKY